MIDINIDLNLNIFTEEKQEKPPVLPYNLFPLQQEWLEHCYKQDNYGVKMLLTAREYGKTDVVSIKGVVDLLEKNPNLTFIVMSRTATKSQLIVSTIGTALQSRGFKGSFSERKVILQERENKKQPSVLSLAMQTSLKMYHCDYLILDDPLDPEDEFSPAWIRRVFLRYQELSGAIAKRVIVLGQYVMENDIYCFLEQQKGVDVMYSWRGSLPALDHNLEKYREEGKTERWIAKNYLGYLLKDESFPFQNIFTGEFGHPSGTLYAYLDPSFTGGDYTALSIGWVKDGNIVVIGKVWKQSWDKLVDEITDLVKLYNIEYLFYEGNSLGHIPSDLFYQKGVLAQRVISKKNKESRILRLTYFIQKNRIVLDLKSDKTYIEQVKAYRAEGCLFDDAPDSLDGLVERLGVFYGK